jgi:acylphosphatase
MCEAGSVVRRAVIVSGRVQGVFFRARCRDEARSADVSGWVSNEPDGTVHAVFEGEPEAVDALVEWCRHGPPQAVVTDVEVTEEEPRGEQGFRAR